MIETAWAQAGDRDEIVEFIDYVFSKAHQPHDFETLLPKLYGAQGDAAAHHFVVREDGKIAATLLCYPVIMHMGGVRLVTLGVGSVSTRPSARGKGYMKLIMDAVDEKAAELGADFAVLGGNRQRYGYFGYRCCGYRMNGHLAKHNAEHVFRDVDAGGMEIVPMTQAHVPQAKRLMESQPCFCERSEAAYLEILRSWNNEPVTLMKDSAAVGFGTLRKNADSCHIAELLLEDETDFPAAMKALYEKYGVLTTAAAPWQKQRAAWLADTCASFEIGFNDLYKIYNPDHVREACKAMDGSEGEFEFKGFALPLPLYVAPPDGV